MKALRLYYCAAARNFGDQMSPLVVSKISGRRVVVANDIIDADLMAIGSVFYDGWNICARTVPWKTSHGVLQRIRSIRANLKGPVSVWGSGFLLDGLKDLALRQVKLDIHAVRGQITLDILRRVGFVNGLNIALGDPGLLYPKLFGINARCSKFWDIGIIPHMSDAPLGQFLFERFSKAGLRVKLINVTDSVESVVTEISLCENILSSSLHGLVIADALNIPSRQMLLSYYSIPDDQFFLKFRDYYSAFGREMPAPLGIKDIVDDEIKVLNEISKSVVPSVDQISDITSNLVLSFPKGLKR